MNLVYENSLNNTLDAINQAFFYGQPLLYEQREQAAAWIATRVGQSGSYAGLPAPTPQDRSEGVRLFTGERLHSGAATAHILGEEACRALRLLGSRRPEVQAAWQRASQGMRARLQTAAQDERYSGGYCCGNCTAALMRNLAAGGLGSAEEYLHAALSNLRADRQTGRWRRYPYYYTILALTEIDLGSAREELRYVAPEMEKSLPRLRKDADFTPRRRALLERALAMC
jgi:hypothetical protein